MPESEFENQVQQELEQLKLRPSAEVWRNVERELRKKKRRRVIIIVFLLAGIALLGYPGYKLFNSGSSELAESNTPLQKETTISTNQDAPSSNSTNSINGSANTENKNPLSNQNSTDKLPGTEADKSDANNTPSGLSGTSVEANSKLNPNIQKNLGVPSIATNNSTGSTYPQKNRKADKKQSDKTPGVPVTSESDKKADKGLSDPGKSTIGPVTSTSISSEVNKNRSNINSPNLTEANPNETAINKETVKNEFIADSVVKTTNADSSLAKADPVTEKKSPPVQTPKFRWGIDFSAGISSSRENSLINANKAAFDQVYYSPPSTGVGASAPTNGLPPVPPSAIKPGFSFMLGAVGEWKLTKRSSLTTGLKYSYMSTKINVGSYRDTALSFNNYASQSVDVRAVYRGNQNSSYTNKYHFIQVPISYQWQMSKNEKHPLFWNMGFGLNYLVGSNGLIYSNAQGGIYYKDKDAYNRFHVSMNTSFLLRLGNQQRISWMIGPEFSMDMTRLIKEAYGNQQYLFYGGITGRWFLPKGKK